MSKQTPSTATIYIPTFMATRTDSTFGRQMSYVEEEGGVYEAWYKLYTKWRSPFTTTSHWEPFEVSKWAVVGESWMRLMFRPGFRHLHFNWGFRFRICLQMSSAHPMSSIVDMILDTQRRQRIQLRKEAVASVVNFRAVQNFHPVWIASVAVPKITGLMKRHMK